MRAVQGGMSTTRAAVEYGVPRSTLHDRISGRILHGVKPGPKRTYTLRKNLNSLNFFCSVLRLDTERQGVTFCQ